MMQLNWVQLTPWVDKRFLLCGNPFYTHFPIVNSTKDDNDDDDDDDDDDERVKPPMGTASSGVKSFTP